MIDLGFSDTIPNEIRTTSGIIPDTPISIVNHLKKDIFVTKIETKQIEYLYLDISKLKIKFGV